MVLGRFAKRYRKREGEAGVRFFLLIPQHGIPFDVWWIDTGWYPCYHENREKDWNITGTWEPDRERFANGLKPVSDRAAQYDADLLLWFEPERVRNGTKLDTEHPEWLLRIKDSDDSL